MVKIDLVTGFLGSGKTTFIKEYASYLISKGENIGILENDFGAVNVDMMALKELEGEHCELEMVAGGCDADCHRRRFKTKLISMAMLGYDRIIVEPSGIYDVDEFFDVLREDPLERWYEIGSVIAIADGGLADNLSVEEQAILASEISHAGLVIFSKMDLYGENEAEHTLKLLNDALESVKCERRLSMKSILQKKQALSDEELERVIKAGYELWDFEKSYKDSFDCFKTVYVMDKKLTREQIETGCQKLFADREGKKVFRIKGFFYDHEWWEFNATKDMKKIKKITDGQDVIIVIGESITEEAVFKAFRL